MAYDLVGFPSTPTSSSSSSPKPLVERDFLSRVEERNYGMSGLDVSLSLSPPLMVIGKRCSACGETKTPLWRNGPDGPKSLCNACGIRYRKEAKKINTNLTLAPPDHVVQLSAKGNRAR
ncbi:gata transcription factor [Musa troglodytarum]|uniref:Gata transcription factor n=1 Tax=Musa troglodytarum TaxID=320322 RepID=A0A9E7JIG8_9LILI|nr:gata transcription factor [Musa troglodytarum]